VRSLDQKIRQMRSRIRYMDVTAGREGASGADDGSHSGSWGGGGGGGGGRFDPVLRKYYEDIWERIQERWHSPGTATGKSLLTVVSIRIRRDGRIMDWNIERKSGNGAYDASVSRTLNSIENLPPIPTSLDMDFIEVGFNFHPPGESR
jgi:hypothetical protein